NQWHHVVLVKEVTSNNVNLRLYIDGVLNGSSSKSRSQFSGSTRTVGNLTMVVHALEVLH
ncbi:MAG: LamG-like jellyroll fold domain-containing protein, partial [Candidatus Pacearchaeota archaeon]